MTPYKIGILIPCTSRGRDDWQSMKDTYLYNLTLKHFLLTQDKEHKYVFYIGYDKDDRLFSDKEQRFQIARFNFVFPNITFAFVQYENVARGHLTKMWNVLFQQAYDDNCDYFYQCGDDIVFKTNGWVNDCIKVLKHKDNVGLVGPINNNFRILTQAFVSRKHMEIFGWFFPEEIINWCCDDWYNLVYGPNLLFPLRKHYCSNDGGNPRYTIHNDKLFIDNLRDNTEKLRKDTAILANKHRGLLTEHIRNVGLA